MPGIAKPQNVIKISETDPEYQECLRKLDADMTGLIPVEVIVKEIESHIEDKERLSNELQAHLRDKEKIAELKKKNSGLTNALEASKAGHGMWLDFSAVTAEDEKYLQKWDADQDGTLCAAEIINHVRAHHNLEKSNRWMRKVIVGLTFGIFILGGVLFATSLAAAEVSKETKSSGGRLVDKVTGKTLRTEVAESVVPLGMVPLLGEEVVAKVDTISLKGPSGLRIRRKVIGVDWKPNGYPLVLRTANSDVITISNVAAGHAKLPDESFDICAACVDCASLVAPTETVENIKDVYYQQVAELLTDTPQCKGKLAVNVNHGTFNLSGKLTQQQRRLFALSSLPSTSFNKKDQTKALSDKRSSEDRRLATGALTKGIQRYLESVKPGKRFEPQQDEGLCSPCNSFWGGYQPGRGLVWPCPAGTVNTCGESGPHDLELLLPGVGTPFKKGHEGQVFDNRPSSPCSAWSSYSPKDIQSWTQETEVVIDSGSCKQIDISNFIGGNLRIAGLKVFGVLQFTASKADTATILTRHVLVTGILKIHGASLSQPFPGSLTFKILPSVNRQPLIFEGIDFGHKAFAVFGGRLELNGMPGDGTTPTWTRLYRSASKNDKEILLRDRVDASWQVGDEIAIASTNWDGSETELVQITSLESTPEGTLARLASPLLFNHYGDGAMLTYEAPHIQSEVVKGHFNLTNMSAEVGYLSRRITIDDAEEDPAIDVYDRRKRREGPHMIVAFTSAPQHIDGVAFVRMGQQGRKSRYPLHMHLCADHKNTVIKRTAVVHSKQRAWVIHGTSQLTFEHNLAYNIAGIAFMQESGYEWGLKILHNLVMVLRPVRRLIVDPDFPNSGESEDDVLHKIKMDNQPTAFWITHPFIEFEGNTVVGACSCSKCDWDLHACIEGVHAKGGVSRCNECSGAWFKLRGGIEGEAKMLPKLPTDVEGFNMNVPFNMTQKAWHFNVFHSGHKGHRYYSPGWQPVVLNKERGMLFYKMQVALFFHRNLKFDLKEFVFADNHVSAWVDINEDWQIHDSLFIGRSPNVGPIDACGAAPLVGFQVRHASNDGPQAKPTRPQPNGQPIYSTGCVFTNFPPSCHQPSVQHNWWLSGRTEPVALCTAIYHQMPKHFLRRHVLTGLGDGNRVLSKNCQEASSPGQGFDVARDDECDTYLWYGDEAVPDYTLGPVGDLRNLGNSWLRKDVWKVQWTIYDGSGLLTTLSTAGWILHNSHFQATQLAADGVCIDTPPHNNIDSWPYKSCPLKTATSPGICLRSVKVVMWKHYKVPIPDWGSSAGRPTIRWYEDGNLKNEETVVCYQERAKFQADETGFGRTCIYYMTLLGGTSHSYEIVNVHPIEAVHIELWDSRFGQPQVGRWGFEDVTKDDLPNPPYREQCPISVTIVTDESASQTVGSVPAWSAGNEHLDMQIGMFAPYIPTARADSIEVSCGGGRTNLHVSGLLQGLVSFKRDGDCEDEDPNDPSTGSVHPGSGCSSQSNIQLCKPDGFQLSIAKYWKVTPASGPNPCHEWAILDDAKNLRMQWCVINPETDELERGELDDEFDETEEGAGVSVKITLMLKGHTWLTIGTTDEFGNLHGAEVLAGVPGANGAPHGCGVDCVFWAQVDTNEDADPQNWKNEVKSKGLGGEDVDMPPTLVQYMDEDGQKITQLDATIPLEMLIGSQEQCDQQNVCTCPAKGPCSKEAHDGSILSVLAWAYGNEENKWTWGNKQHGLMVVDWRKGPQHLQDVPELFDCGALSNSNACPGSMKDWKKQVGKKTFRTKIHKAPGKSRSWTLDVCRAWCEQVSLAGCCSFTTERGCRFYEDATVLGTKNTDSQAGSVCQEPLPGTKSLLQCFT